MELNGVGAIVTGGASGLGEAAARRLHAAGANVVIADVNEEGGRRMADELGRKTEFVRCALSRTTKRSKRSSEVASSHGPLLVAVNCGGRAGGEESHRRAAASAPASHGEGFSITVESFLDRHVQRDGASPRQRR